MMTKKQQAIFEQFNPSGDVVRCPYGRSGVRTTLHEYAVAAINLYGMISCEELVTIFNEQNEEQTDEDELYVLLLPLVFKKGFYCFYKTYIVNYVYTQDFDEVDHMIERQGDKPRYVPEREEFLRYADEYYTDNDYWFDVLEYLYDYYDNPRHAVDAYWALRDYLTFNLGISELGPIMEEHGLVLDFEDIQGFLDLLVLAQNHTRIWLNKGYSPADMREFLEERQEKVIDFPAPETRVIGRNDPCYCGSGKKYKLCCLKIEQQKTAQISHSDAQLFYNLWIALLTYVNGLEHVVTLNPDIDNFHYEQTKRFEIREVLWEKPELIEGFIREHELNPEEVAILKGWQTGFKKETFTVLEYRKNYALVMSANEDETSSLYGVKGISEPMASAIKRPPPLLVDFVMLPFKGQIIYDSFLEIMPMTFGDGAKAMFKEFQDEAMEKGIATSLM